MSMYMQFYVRGGDNFYPIGTYNRNSAVYEMFKEVGYGDWEKIRAITVDGLVRVSKEINDNIRRWSEAILKLENKIALIKDTNRPIDEMLEQIDEYIETIDEYKDIIKHLESCDYFVCFLDDILSEAESTKYYDNVETIDPHKYVYVGIEVGSPTIEDVVGE